MRDKIFYAICFGFASGVLLRSFIFIDFYFAILFGMVAFALFVFFTFASKSRWGIVACIFVLAFSLGILRFHIADVPPPQSLENKVDQKIFLTGKIADEPDMRESNQKLTVLLNEKTKILLSTSLDGDYKYGDNVSFSGKLE